MALKELSYKDKDMFNRFLNFKEHRLCAYAFENIYIWKGLFCIQWALIDNCLCIFFQDKIGCFLYLAPQGGQAKPGVLEKVFRLMDSFNQNKEVSRIENIEEEDISFYSALGYDCQVKSRDYLCQRSSLAGLKGDKLKSKRASCNYFLKHNLFEYLPFGLRYRDDCLKLYQLWAKQRKARFKDAVYQGMLLDSRNCLEILLQDYQRLNITGRVIKVGGAIKAFSFGFKLSAETFCILYEITDLSIKGIAQFIFRSLAQDLKDYKYINIMDDSGLENLRRVKLSYQPVKLIPAYIAKRKPKFIDNGCVPSISTK